MEHYHICYIFFFHILFFFLLEEPASLAFAIHCFMPLDLERIRRYLCDHGLTHRYCAIGELELYGAFYVKKKKKNVNIIFFFYICTRQFFIYVMHITDNFTLEELIRSTTAERNHISQSEPPYSVVIALTRLCVCVLQPLREHFGEPLIISSGYRCPALNKLVGGVYNSQHITGQAVDIYLGGDTMKETEYFRYIRKHLDYDQLILEGNQKSSWIHVSYNSPKLNRHQSWIQLQKTDGAS